VSALRPIERVFVYGILLRRNETTPPGDSASLEGYRLAFDGGLATIEPSDDPEEYVAGAVLYVTRDELRSFDGIEGYRPEAPLAGLYRRERVWADTEHEQREAWVYIKNRRHGPAAPHAGMLATIHRGYVSWELDTDKLEQAIDRAREEVRA